MTIDRFHGAYRFLSNFYPSPVAMDGYGYPTVEHAYQAAKCDRHEDRIEIRLASTPGEAKRLGRQMDLRPDWHQVRVAVMTELVLQKFAWHPRLRRQLLATESEELIEGNTWHDTFWGVCAGCGENNLGKILMRVRERLSR